MADAFRLTSPDFEVGGTIPRRYTCDGDDASPPLAWEGAPDAAVSFALIVHDPDARDFAHWIVFGMTASQTGALPEGVSASPDAPPQGTNDFGRLGWSGPCPPSGVHRYVFTLHALSDVPAIAGAPRVADVRRAIEGLVIDRAVLEAGYGRG
jgi:Raf kinase inhibitor-like YbhB/YbcL family protein